MRARLRSNRRSRSVRPPERTTPTDLADFKPRTALGSDLLRIRRRIIASGEPMLGWKQLDREIARRRGEAAGAPV